jgi:hypothetical protein
LQCTSMIASNINKRKFWCRRQDSYGVSAFLGCLWVIFLRRFGSLEVVFEWTYQLWFIKVSWGHKKDRIFGNQSNMEALDIFLKNRWISNIRHCLWLFYFILLCIFLFLIIFISCWVGNIVRIWLCVFIAEVGYTFIF